MAASGIAEHDEARRRERGYLQKAYLMKQAMEAEKNNQRQIMMEVSEGKRPAAMGHNDQKCEAARHSNVLGTTQYRQPQTSRSKTENYSAKLPHRYTSIDYQSQW